MEKQGRKKHRIFISAIVILIAGAASLGGAALAGGLDRDAWANANAKLRAAQGLYEEPKSETAAYDAGEFSSINFDITSHGIIMEKGTSDKFELSYAQDFDGQFDVGITDNALTLKQNGTNPQGKSFFKYFVTNLDWVVGFFDGWEDYMVRLTVPAGFAFDKVKIYCTSGTVRLNGIDADSADIRATSGAVRLENTEITGRLDLHLTSGSLHFNDGSAGDITATLTSGDARFDNVTAAALDMVLTSGSFHLTGVTAGEMTATLTSGGLKVNSSDIKTSRIDLSSGSARFSDMPDGFTSAATAFNVKVTSGSIKIDGKRKESPYVSAPQDAAYKIEGKLTSGSFKFN